MDRPRYNFRFGGRTFGFGREVATKDWIPAFRHMGAFCDLAYWRNCCELCNGLVGTTNSRSTIFDVRIFDNKWNSGILNLGNISLNACVLCDARTFYGWQGTYAQISYCYGRIFFYIPLDSHVSIYTKYC